MEDNFFDRVYDVVVEIPWGRVSTYGAIARFLGSGRSARMVGWALNNCHSLQENIPAHRVVNRNGQLSGKQHFGSPDIMQKLLENEGVKVVDDQISDFQSLFWDPAKHLSTK